MNGTYYKVSIHYDNRIETTKVSINSLKEIKSICTSIDENGVSIYAIRKSKKKAYKVLIDYFLNNIENLNKEIDRQSNYLTLLYKN